MVSFDAEQRLTRDDVKRLSVNPELSVTACSMVRTTARSAMGQGPALLSMEANGGFRVVSRHPGSMIAGFEWGGWHRRDDQLNWQIVGLLG
jgi:hypothetical protein